MPSAGVGSERECTGRLPTTKNPNTEMAMASSTMVATPSRLLAARSTRASRSSRRTIAGHEHHLEHERQAGQHVELGHVLGGGHEHGQSAHGQATGRRTAGSANATGVHGAWRTR